jgi:uncharacterized protein (DUF1501 family)
MNDIKKNGKADDVLLMTFSEFGRRVQENASNAPTTALPIRFFCLGIR